MLNWLKKSLAVSQNSILEAGVFGSVANGATTPTDCDLYIVSDKSPDSIQWQQLKRSLNQIREDFSSQFRLTLNVILMSLGEWEEKKEFFLCSSHIALIENRPTRR